MIRTHRKNKGFTQVKLAKEAGMSEQYLRAFENGRANNISAKLFNKWADALFLTPVERCEILRKL